MVPLQFWCTVLVLSLGLGSTLNTKDAEHKDDIHEDSDQLSNFYQAVEQALPELQELRSSFESLRKQHDHFHTLNEMLANFDQPEDAESQEELTNEEEEWQESTKAWIRELQAAQKIPDHEMGLKTKEKREGKMEESLKDSKLEKDSLTKRESLLQPSAIEEKVQDKLKNDPKAAPLATNINPEATGKLVDIGARKYPRQSGRTKRSLEENQQDQQPQQRVVTKRKAQLLDDFEDHNGNRVRFGDLGNGMLIPNAEDLAGQTMSFPGHELLSHYNELEASHGDDSLAHIYDPTKNLVPMVSQQANVAPQAQPQQQQAPQQQQQQQQQQPQQQQQQAAANFKASFNLNHFFNELQKLQNLQPAAPAIQQPVQAAPAPVQVAPAPAPVQQQIQYQPVQNQAPAYQYPNKAMAPPVKPHAIHRYLGPIFHKQQVKTNFGSNPAVDPNCIPSTPAPVAEAMTRNPCVTPAAAIDDACNKADSLKMNVSINANVCGDPKTKQFSGNGSISLQPAYSQDTHKDKDERHVREVADVSNDEWELKGDKKPRGIESHIKMPYMKWPGKKQASSCHLTPQKEAPKGDRNITGKCGHRLRMKPEERSNSFDDLISGRLSEDIVDAVFEAVSNDPEMERLLPVLQRNRKCSQKQQKNFYQIRNDKNENFLRHTESMVRDTMEAISEIIDQQVRRRACIPLRPDLVDFYELILKTWNEEQQVREKRQSSLRVLAEEFSEDVRLLDPSKINQKTRVVKKLLNQYQDLPLGEQLAAAEVHDELLLDLEYLRKMADTAERRQRNARLQEVLKQESLDTLLEEHMNNEYSPRFIKLLKTAELFKESGEQQAKDLI